MHQFKMELIDTLWNVNKGVYVFDFSDNGGINRYIMECKFNSLSVILTVCRELIDTLWNVNVLFVIVF